MNKTSVAMPVGQDKRKVTSASPDDLIPLASMSDDEQQGLFYLSGMKGGFLIRVTRVETYIRRADLEANCV